MSMMMRPQVPGVNVPMPDPEAVAKQKEAYARELEVQLKDGAEKLGQNMKQQIDALHAQAQQEKSLHSLLVDQQVKQQELLLSQQYNQQLMRLTQAAQRQGAELEQQATNLMLEYQQRKVEEDFINSQAGVERQYAEMQAKFSNEFQKVAQMPMQAPPFPVPQLVPQMPATLMQSPTQMQANTVVTYAGTAAPTAALSQVPGVRHVAGMPTVPSMVAPITVPSTAAYKPQVTYQASQSMSGFPSPKAVTTITVPPKAQ